MRSLEETLEIVESSYDDMVETMIGMISIPALAPVNGGDGESRKADYLQERLVGFDSVRRIDVPDDVDLSVIRSNILAVRNGREKGTVWVMAHMDVVPAGDPGLWDNPPYEPVYRDGRVYGRGTEDNGQSIISAMFSSRAVLDQELQGMSLGVAYVADEETTSMKGIRHLLDLGVFSKDDIIIVPDWGSPGGTLVEVAEKSVLWLRVSVEGKTCHGSSPQSGLNAYRVSTYLLADLLDRLPERFPARDGMFRPPESTFEPTKRPATVENVNTIPGHDEFCMDMRILPVYPGEDRRGDLCGNRPVRTRREEVLYGHRRIQRALRCCGECHRQPSGGRRRRRGHMRQLLQARRVRRLCVAVRGRDSARTKRVRGDVQPDDGRQGVRDTVLQPVRQKKGMRGLEVV